MLIAPAWDMTELMWERFSASARRDIEEKGVYLRPSDYGDGPYPITRAFIEDGRRHLIGSEPLDPGRPVHILHGLQDPDVPWEHTLDLVAHLTGDWARVSAVPDGEHRLSRPEDIALLLDVVREFPMEREAGSYPVPRLERVEDGTNAGQERPRPAAATSSAGMPIRSPSARNLNCNSAVRRLGTRCSAGVRRDTTGAITRRRNACSCGVPARNAR